MARDRNPHNLDAYVLHSLGEEEIKRIIDWVARFSYWVAPEVYKEVPVVYPRTRRKRGKDEKDGDIVDGIRLCLNQPAQRAFWLAYGKSQKDFTSCIVCHIYPGSVYKPDHFTNLANLTVFPRSLESFSEWNPIRKVLIWHSYKTYGYMGPNGIEPDNPLYYPEHWPGTRSLSVEEEKQIIKKLSHQRDLRPDFSGGRKPSSVVHRSIK